MSTLKILNSKEVKHILGLLKGQYGYEADKQELDFIFLMNKDNRIYILSREVGNIDLDALRIDALGMYFGELYKESLRLSIEGAQLVGPHAIKNVVFLEREEMLSWVKGNDIPYDNKEEGVGKDFLIVKYHDEKAGKDDVLGCGRYSEKDKKLLNYVSKSRRLVVVNE